MGIVKKFGFDARTLDETVVKDGLEAVSMLNEKEPYFLVGGIATQSYLPTICRRPTSDVDFALVRPLSKPDFREMVKPVVFYLRELGYDVTTHTSGRSRSFALYLSKPDEECNDCLCLEFVRRSNEAFAKSKNRLEREYANTREKIIEERDLHYRVSSPEDIAVPKLVRSINSLRRDPTHIKLIPPKLESFSDEEVKRRIEIINEIRSEAVTNPGDPFLASKLRLVSDMYDIRMLAELVGFNREYFGMASSDWNSIDGNPEFRDAVYKVALPMFLGKPETNL